MHKKHGEFTQNTPSSTWEVNNIPEGAKQSVVTYIETTEGEILQPDDQKRAPYGIQLSFGVREVSGTAYYDYLATDEDVTINGNGGTINVTINQNNNGGAASEPYNFPEPTTSND